MRTRTVVAATVAIAVSLSASLSACGDKFLVPARGARFKVKVNREAAAVLVYAAPGTMPESMRRTLAVEARLRAAGYRPTLITTLSDLEAVLDSRWWDVVVVDLDGASVLVTRLGAAPSPAVVPVAHNAPKTVVENARRRYRHLIDPSKKPQAWIDAIDGAVLTRAGAGAKARARTGT